MIEVKNVVKSFDGFRALDGLTMTVPHGAVYGLVGPNGAGKSTIIRHLAGIYRQDSGDVLVDGQPVYENTAVKRRMAVIGDDWYYFPQSGIREIIYFSDKYAETANIRASKRMLDAAGVRYHPLQTELASITLDFRAPESAGIPQKSDADEK